MQIKVLLVSVFILLLSCKTKKDDKLKNSIIQPPPFVDVMIASTKSVSNTVETNGTVIANEMVDIHPEISGRLTFVNIPEGAAVTTGTVLAKINDADLQAQLAKSKVQLDLAKKTEERLRKLLSISGINQADYDAALNNVNNIKADIELLKAQIDKTIIKAPFNGLLGLRNISQGAFVTSATSLVTLQQIDKIKIDFTIPEQYTPLIKKGNSVDVVTNYSKTKLKAIVIATEPEMNTATRNLKVRAILQDGKLQVGSFVKILIQAGDNNKSIMIPTNAIIPDADSKKVVIVKDGKGKYVPIETGLRTASSVEITKGINVGDTVVITGVLFVRNNSPVKVKKIIEN
ncbi:MAG: efflux RND transporter periplasmic adaptor subunit [Chitinophagaceae bacterium]